MHKRILASVLATALLLVVVRPGQSNADQEPEDVSVTLPGGPRAPGSSGGGSCPNYQKSGIYTQVGGGSSTAPTYGYFEYTCDGVTWVQVWGCIANCPPGVATFVAPPLPGFVEAELVKSAPDPEGFFAPPVHRDGVKAITGLRLYVHITDETYKTVTAEVVENVQWHASATETSGKVTLDVDGVSVSCDSNPPSPATESGRNRSECFIPITTVPKGGKAHVTLTVQWRVLIVTNVPGVRTDFLVDKVTELDIGVKELQAVGIR